MTTDRFVIGTHYILVGDQMKEVCKTVAIASSWFLIAIQYFRGGESWTNVLIFEAT